MTNFRSCTIAFYPARESIPWLIDKVLSKGDDIVCEIPIRPDEAVLGSQIKIPTPDGSVTMSIPAGVRSGQSLRLRGKGWPKPKDGRSDQIVKLQIVSSKDISQIERDCYEKIRANSSFNPRAGLDEVRL